MTLRHYSDNHLKLYNDHPILPSMLSRPQSTPQSNNPTLLLGLFQDRYQVFGICESSGLKTKLTGECK